MNLTNNELLVMNHIHEVMDIYGDGFSDVMTEDLVEVTKISMSSIKGVLGSLAKKQLVNFIDVNGEYYVYALTPKGCDMMGIRPDYYDELMY